MLSWSAVIVRHVRWSSPVTQGLLLCTLTFSVILPLACHRLMYSYYFLKFMHLDAMSEQALEDSHRRGQEALRFWRDMTAAQASALTPTSAPNVPELLVTVVTARRREGQEYHYLLQVMRRLLALLGDCGKRPCAEVLVCDVESSPALNEDAALLEKQFLVVRRSAGEKSNRRARLNTFEREKQDYVFCLRQGWEMRRPRNVVVLEDDALPRPDFFAVVHDLLSRSFARNTLYVKLYHPERLQRYWNPEPYRLLEWAGLGLLGSSLLLLLFLFSSCSCALLSFSLPHLLFFAVFIMVAVEMVGRHYLLELRRLSPQLYAVSPATECCTPAMLYPGNASARVADYLERAQCSKGNAKDMVLYRIARSTPGERAHSVEPNAISHIGAFSSVRTNPARPKLLP
ncbi:transmembrane protein 246 [Engraulis encrasicolus]|uniref:transmembrane protein 246 n=1 Tax=Engraulis encrasicolus TaxID=184585 RepID=UPI002FD4A723